VIIRRRTIRNFDRPFRKPSQMLVIPAKAGIQFLLCIEGERLDPGLRRDDEMESMRLYGCPEMYRTGTGHARFAHI